jgi:small subunit ribosomal protein S17
MDEENKDITETAEPEISENSENSENIENIENAEIAENINKPERSLRKERTGIVVSNKMNKTVVVKIEERVTHEKYGKIMRHSIKFKAHDENNECDIGDKVLIMETRPLSKDKHFRLVKILEKVK